jgi:UDP-glucuronate 4-epimerase
MAKILVTGAAGFIGYHFCTRLLERGHEVLGVDNLSPYYDVSLKDARLSRLTDDPGFGFRRLDISDRRATEDLFASEKPTTVVNLAAQAGVRYSLQNPHAYADSNLIGFLNILEGCRRNDVEHLVFASSSSVYGANSKMPFAVDDNVDHPVSLYAATKKSNELMAHSYSHLYGLPTTGLRFFTVYGPWGRPDMAMFLFTKAILEGRPINVFNEGNMERDFTYIDDIVEGMTRVMEAVPHGRPELAGKELSPGTSHAPYRIYNIGNNRPEQLMRLIELLERKLDRPAELRLLPMQPGDVQATFADIDGLTRDLGFRPKTSLEEGVSRFVDWYLSFYRQGAEPVAGGASA